MKKEIFHDICSQVFSFLENNEQLTIYLEGENSQYFRFNDSKLRQSGIIEDYAVTISLFSGKKSLQSAARVRPSGWASNFAVRPPVVRYRACCAQVRQIREPHHQSIETPGQR